MLEYLLIRHLYQRDHMDQVLATFGLILFFNELMGLVSVQRRFPTCRQACGFFIYPDTPIRFTACGHWSGLVCAAAIHHLVTRTKIWAMVIAGDSNESMAAALGVNIGLLRRFIFSAGACFAGIAGIMLGPLTAVEPGMGEPLLILSLVVIIIGGLGSVHGEFIAAVVVGIVDTLGRVVLPLVLRSFMEQSAADGAGPALASIMVYLLMTVVGIQANWLFPPLK